jgi:hypothetical protein
MGITSWFKRKTPSQGSPSPAGNPRPPNEDGLTEKEIFKHGRLG